ncbi:MULTISPECIES: hypothetical protein [unclassified Brenneria]|uniref:hypothetical protein n=1 Tax=unclassified Brenneria TaxID=2634434 RepID=UPI0029C39BB8|nr:MULTISPECIES: hypothetical protein [unclassified Brenneria]MDX5631077.1 hypothetical protein [Brenneria sp. L3-3Z]MDX5698150.1 hypothetical protein [Brenneria sp. L4-2C]
MDSKSHLENLLNSNDIAKVSETLLYIAHNINNVEWAEKNFMRMANNSNEDISGLALTCLGHIARVNGRISKEIVIPFLKEKINNTRLCPLII